MAWAVAAIWLGTGAYAFLAPRSFYDQLATFPPYNVHFVHDIGAFSLGLGAVVAFALLGWSARRSALLGVGAGSAVHVVSHLIDYDLKPSPSDIAVFAVGTALAITAGVLIDRAPGRD
jgi:peptidoglycan/LPS O-acetylase OafA/YrhL